MPRPLPSAFKKSGTSAAYPYGAMNFTPALGIRSRIANICTMRHGMFKGLSQDEGGEYFLKTFAPLSLIKAF